VQVALDELPQAPKVPAPRGVEIVKSVGGGPAATPYRGSVSTAGEATIITWRSTIDRGLPRRLYIQVVALFPTFGLMMLVDATWMKVAYLVLFLSTWLEGWVRSSWVGRLAPFMTRRWLYYDREVLALGTGREPRRGGVLVRRDAIDQLYTTEGMTRGRTLFTLRVRTRDGAVHVLLDTPEADEARWVEQQVELAFAIRDEPSRAGKASSR
jgi:hypothetical protein